MALRLWSVDEKDTLMAHLPVISTLLLLCACTSYGICVGQEWPSDLWLDGGGFWTNRVRVTVKNQSTQDWQGVGIAVSVPFDANRADVRVTDESGSLLQYSVVSNDALALPISARRDQEASCWVYWGNPRAMRLRDCHVAPMEKAQVKAVSRLEEIESLELAYIGEASDWPKDEWDYRVPLFAANMTDHALEHAAFHIRLAEATRETMNPSWELRHGDAAVKADTFGSDIMYYADVPPRSVAVHYLYVRSGRPLATELVAESLSSASIVPNDTEIDDKPKFPKGIIVRNAHIGALECAERLKAQGLSIGQSDLAVLVFRDRPVKDSRDGFSVSMARNEGESLQLAVRSHMACTNFSCEATPPMNAQGRKLGISAGWVESVFVDAPSAFYVHEKPAWHLMYPHTRHPSSDGWSGWWPDPIASGGDTALEADSTKAFRLLVTTTPETQPGEYHGVLIWRENGREVRRDPYTVRVWNFVLPARRRFAATFDTRGLKTQKERERVYALMSRYGIQGDQACRTLDFRRNEAGEVTCDFSQFDSLTEDFFGKWGFRDSYFPRQPFSAFGWGRQPSDFMGEKAYESGATVRANLRSAYREAYQAALRLFWNHLKEKGWEKRFVLYLSDEPYVKKPEIVAQLKALCRMIHEVSPDIRIYASTWGDAPGLEDSIDIWGISASGRYPVDKIPSMKANGRSFWFTTDAQFPLDTPYLASERLFPIIGYFLGVDKYECWNCINYPKAEPWTYATDSFRPRFGIPGKKDRWVRVPCGDGVLMYPPRNGGDGSLVPTVRLDAIRDGMEDYEYMLLLATNGTAEARQILREYRKLAIVPNPGGRYSKRMLPDPLRLGKLRMAAGELLDRLAGGDVGDCKMPDWPPLTQSMRPWAYNWWMGSAITHEGIETQCQAMSKAGFGGFHVIPIYGAKGYERNYREYLSPEWVDAWNDAVRTARKYGLGVDLTMGSGWCFGGPWVSKADAASSGMQVKRAGPGGKGSMIDPFSVAAMSNYVTRFDAIWGNGATGDVERPRAFYHDSYEYMGAVPKTKGNWDDLQNATFGVWTKWCRDNGYLTRQEAHGSPGNWLDLYAQADIPETEMFAHDCRDILISKFASSAAHVAGRKLVSSETGTWLCENFHEKLADMKRLVDRLFLSGVNHIFYHGLCYSPPEAVWPGWSFYAASQINPRNPIWHDIDKLNAYVSRCQSIFQTSVPDEDTLLYFPYADSFDSLKTPDRRMSVHNARTWFYGCAIGAVASRLHAEGCAFDYVSDRQLKAIDLARYARIVVPQTSSMPSETADAIRRFQPRTPRLEPFPAHGLSFARFRRGKGHVYFLVNTNDTAVTADVAPTACGAIATLMYPMDGRIERVGRLANGKIRLVVQAGESVFLHIGVSPVANVGVPKRRISREMAIRGPWNLIPVCGGPALPPPRKMLQLTSWSRKEDGCEESFSGTMRYTTRFDYDGPKDGTVVLNLGRVYESARVFVGGEEVGFAFMSPYEIRFPAHKLKPVGNDLDVDVTSTAANRIRWNDLTGVKWKYFNDVNIVAYCNTRKQLDAATWPLEDCGLLGPVSYRVETCQQMEHGFVDRKPDHMAIQKE